jgi:hypothetical protein
MNLDLKKAVYEMRRTQVLSMYLNGQLDHQSNLVYSYNQRMYPYFSEGYKEREYYSDCYEIDKKFIEKVLGYLEENAKNNQNSDAWIYYNLDIFFGSDNVWKLNDVIRYCKLSHRFSSKEYDFIVNIQNTKYIDHQILSSLSKDDISLLE